MVPIKKKLFLSKPSQIALHSALPHLRAKTSTACSHSFLFVVTCYFILYYLLFSPLVSIIALALSLFLSNQCIHLEVSG